MVATPGQHEHVGPGSALLVCDGELACEGLSSQVLTTKEDENLAFISFTDRMIRVWELWDCSMVRDLSGYLNKAKSIIVKDLRIWTGSLDTCLRALWTTWEPLEY
jgi:hypothetical protein